MGNSFFLFLIRYNSQEKKVSHLLDTAGSVVIATMVDSSTCSAACVTTTGVMSDVVDESVGGGGTFIL